MIKDPVWFLKKLEKRKIETKVLIAGYVGFNNADPVVARHCLSKGQKLYMCITRNPESSLLWDLIFVYMYPSSAKDDSRKWTSFEELRPFIFN